MQDIQKEAQRTIRLRNNVHHTDHNTVNRQDRLTQENQSGQKEQQWIAAIGFICFTSVHKYHYINKHRHVDPHFVPPPLQVTRTNCSRLQPVFRWTRFSNAGQQNELAVVKFKLLSACKALGSWILLLATHFVDPRRWNVSIWMKTGCDTLQYAQCDWVAIEQIVGARVGVCTTENCCWPECPEH